jgi:hypothetical protein
VRLLGETGEVAVAIFSRGLMDRVFEVFVSDLIGSLIQPAELGNDVPEDVFAKWDDRANPPLPDL